MTRIVSSIFAVAFAVSFNACEGHSVKMLPPHYQHKMHHGHAADENHSKSSIDDTKDPNRKHKDGAAPAGHPAGQPEKKQ